MADQSISPRTGTRKKTSPIRIEGDVAYVGLTRGLEAAIDIEDVSKIAGYKWHALSTKSSAHVYASTYRGKRNVLMHRVLLDAPAGMWVDHKDHNGLNNRRSNIRLSTPNENMANKVREKRNKAGAKGVYFNPKSKMYRATIKPEGKTIHLGNYHTKEEAIAAYWGAATVLWGDFAHI